MAKSVSPNLAKLQKNLSAASKALSKLSPKAPQGSAFTSTTEAHNLVRVHQVYCPEHEQAIGDPTTDIIKAKRTRDRHNDQFDHHAKVKSSN